jgi:hypothetical protein
MMSENEIVGMTYMQALQKAEEYCLSSKETYQAWVEIVAKAEMLALSALPSHLAHVSNCIERLIHFMQNKDDYCEDDKIAIGFLRYANHQLNISSLVPRITQGEYDKATGANKQNLATIIKGQYLPFKEFEKQLLDAVWPEQTSISVVYKRDRYLAMAQENSLAVKVGKKYYYHPELVKHDIFAKDGRTVEQRDKGNWGLK